MRGDLFQSLFKSVQRWIVGSVVLGYRKITCRILPGVEYRERFPSGTHAGSTAASSAMIAACATSKLITARSLISPFAVCASMRWS